MAVSGIDHGYDMDLQCVCLLDHYEILDVINEGSFGVVYKGRDKKSGDIVAVKEEVHGLSRSTLMEIGILESLPRHPNLVEFKRAVTDRGHVFVVMEFLEFDLKRLRLARRKPFSLPQIRFIMREILRGVAFLHDKGVMHRDLKPANILFGGANKVIKICDFGLAARCGRSFGAGVGTRYYKAPEVLVGCCSYTCAMDMWSLGCMMAEFILDRPIFEGGNDDEQLTSIREILCGRSNLLRLKMGATAGSGFDLLEKLLEYYPNQRISAADALTHPWFTHVSN